MAELEGRDPEARKRKKIEGSFGLDGYEPPDEVWYARAKELEATDQSKQLEAPEERRLIESAPVPAFTEQPQQEAGGGGIISSSTLAALKGFAGANITTQAPQKAAGPLVAYGSDDESD